MGRKKARKSKMGRKKKKKKMKRGNHKKRFQRGGSFFGLLDHIVKHANDPGMPTLRQSANRRLNKIL